MAKITKNYNLASLYPEIAKEWHPTKNGELTPDKVTPSSAKKVWWKCEKNHSFEARVFHKKNKADYCPYCSNRKLGYGNDLESAYPHIAKEWHPTKNGDLLPSNLISGSAKKVWWLCKFGHEWSTTLTHRVSHGTNCPKCTNRVSRPVLFIVSELSTIFKFIDFEKKINDVFVDIFIEEINLIIEYDGAFFHKGQFQKDKLKRKSLIKDGYSLINIRVSPLRKIFKDDITINSKDNRSFLLISKILNKIINSGIINDKAIIFKANKYLKIGSIQNEKYFYDLTSKFPAPSPGSTLYDKFPNLKDEWHPTKNGEMTIHDYTYASHTKVWWQCKYGHEWQAQIARRYFGNNCPYCCGQKVGYGNDLKSKYPKIATLWHPTKNGSISTSDVMPGSHKKYWWKCSFGHVWEERIDSMVKKQDCLYCKNPNYKRNFHVFINNKKVGEWTSKAQCAKDLGLKSKGNISSCLNKKLNSYMGYTFEYKQNNDT